MMTYLDLKREAPVAAALLRKQMPRSFHGHFSDLDFELVDGDVVCDSDHLPEPIVLRACSREWTWLDLSDVNFSP